MLKSYSAMAVFILASCAMMLSGCNEAQEGEAKTTVLMKASKDFGDEAKNQVHAELMRAQHMVLMKHKRDETMYQGIRTEQNSIKACIDCHVPYKHNGEALRADNEQHFCATCHVKLFVKIDCFQCHADRPQGPASALAMPVDGVPNTDQSKHQLPQHDIKLSMKAMLKKDLPLTSHSSAAANPTANPAANLTANSTANSTAKPAVKQERANDK